MRGQEGLVPAADHAGTPSFPRQSPVCCHEVGGLRQVPASCGCVCHTDKRHQPAARSAERVSRPADPWKMESLQLALLLTGLPFPPQRHDQTIGNQNWPMTVLTHSDCTELTIQQSTVEPVTVPKTIFRQSYPKHYVILTKCHCSSKSDIFMRTSRAIHQI